ncbi:hypothetical protein PYW07_013010 [Mythimna separata]|uniref:Uncharacterized protein n=1 Tax=Mythimna separata TaxID=271217 RepID=A0AAD7Y5L0_MYTSE|nr:hypothetical protein PYW07_013010 [Mythimna separata]
MCNNDAPGCCATCLISEVSLLRFLHGGPLCVSHNGFNALRVAGPFYNGHMSVTKPFLYSRKNCYATPRYVKCLRQHGTTDCPRPKDRTQCEEPPSCVLCGFVSATARREGLPRAILGASGIEVVAEATSPDMKPTRPGARSPSDRGGAGHCEEEERIQPSPPPIRPALGRTSSLPNVRMALSG